MSRTGTLGRIVVLAMVMSTTVAAQPGGGPKPAGPRDQSLIVLPQKPDFVLWDGDKRIAPGTVGLVYQVEKVDRLRLLLAALGHGVRGWSPSSAVISLKLAEDYFTHAITIKPGDPFAYLMRAIARSEKGDADGAVRDLNEALARDPQYVPALVRRAALLRSRNQLERALADLDRATASDRHDPSAYVERARIPLHPQGIREGVGGPRPCDVPRLAGRDRQHLERPGPPGVEGHEEGLRSVRASVEKGPDAP